MRGTSEISRIASLGLVGAMILSACAAPAGAAQQQLDDHSYDQVERMRSLVVQAAPTDTSYDQIEHMRGGDSSGQAAPPDTSYDQIEHLRGGDINR